VKGEGEIFKWQTEINSLSSPHSNFDIEKFFFILLGRNFDPLNKIKNFPSTHTHD
jgi:hypothetical protein